MMIKTRSIIESVRYRPAMYLGDSITHGDVAKLTALILYDIITANTNACLTIAVEVHQASQVKVTLKHSIFADSPIVGLFNDMGIAMLIGLSADCIVTNNTGSIFLQQGNIVNEVAASKHINELVIDARLDDTILPNPFFDVEILVRRLTELACFFPNHTYTLLHKDKGNVRYFNSFHAADGLMDLFKHLLGYRLPAYFFYQNKQWLRWEKPYEAVQSVIAENKEVGIKLSMIVAPFNNIETLVLSYIDYELAPQEGSHIDLLKDFLGKIKNEDAYEYAQGFTCLVSIECGFKYNYWVGATKDRVESPLLDELMRKAVTQLKL